MTAHEWRETAAQLADASACGACRALRTFGDAIRAMPLPAAPPDKTAEALEIARKAINKLMDTIDLKNCSTLGEKLMSLDLAKYARPLAKSALAAIDAAKGPSL